MRNFGKGMDGHSRNFKIAVHGAMIECFDVLEFMNKIVPWCREGTRCHSVKHKSVIWVWGMTYSNYLVAVFVKG